MGQARIQILGFSRFWTFDIQALTVHIVICSFLGPNIATLVLMIILSHTLGYVITFSKLSVITFSKLLPVQLNDPGLFHELDLQKCPEHHQIPPRTNSIKYCYGYSNNLWLNLLHFMSCG